MEISRLTRDETAEPVSRDQILRCERGQGTINFQSSADHEQGWQPYPVDPHSSYMCDHTRVLNLHRDQSSEGDNRGEMGRSFVTPARIATSQ